MEVTEDIDMHNQEVVKLNNDLHKAIQRLDGQNGYADYYQIMCGVNFLSAAIVERLNKIEEIKKTKPNGQQESV